MKELAPTAVAEVERLATKLASAVDLDPAVHTTRKGTKRLRSFLRLARRSIGTDVYRTENAALRDAARMLAPARDALVLIETARELNASRSVLTILERRHLDEITQLESGVLADATASLTSIASRWRALDWQGPDIASIRAGLTRTYRRGRADLAAVRAQPSASAFHSWRRRVKYVRYQLEAVGASDGFTGPWLSLGDELGWEHDHTVLIAVCRVHSDDGFRLVAERSNARREVLRATALEAGDQLFVLRPRAFVESVACAVGVGEG